MRITHIGSILLEPTRWVLVKVKTDEGLTGIGEAYHGAGVHQIVVDERLRAPLIGRDPRHVDRLFRDMILATPHRILHGGMGNKEWTYLQGPEF